jgi:hypothetical protein
MRTPAGTECPYFYEDWNRGRERQECRLILKNPESLPWAPADCAKCAVPAILRANGSEDLALSVTVKKRLGLVRSVVVTAECKKHGSPIPDPYVGCPACRAEAESL